RLGAATSVSSAIWTWSPRTSSSRCSRTSRSSSGCSRRTGRRSSGHPPSPARQAGLRPRRLEQFALVARGVVEQDLPAAHARDDVVAEVDSLLAQRVHGAGEVAYLEHEPVPAAGLLLPAIGHGSRTATPLIGSNR